jgi:CheY-like chemotaxis protein/HPt (histidine-containing phosphotransfer) domain-containing protein
MGGEIGVDSEEGRGSTFWFTAVFSKTIGTELDRRRDKELRRTIECLLAPSLSCVNNSGSDFMTSYASAENGRIEIRILLVEDYPTNQAIAKRHLEHAGYQVDLAENGAVAVEAFRCGYYDLILMDVEMPVMDGCQATRAIRELEAERAPEKTHRVPIVAMTAHAFREKKELCLAAGMDDFLSKPVTKNELISMVAKRLTISMSRSSIPSDGVDLSQPAITGPEASPHAVRSGKPIDLERAIDEFDGDKELLSEVIAGFTDNVSRQIASMREALSCDDAETLRREAHAIKGGAAGLTADHLSTIAAILENKGKSKDLHDAGEVLTDLEREFDALRRYIQQNLSMDARC